MHNDNILFKNKYRIPSTRLKGWDYSSEGWYYITICTNDRECLFGDVVNGEMRLNPIGEIVREEWEKSFEIRRELICDTYIIMPNHIHGLIGIKKPIDADTLTLDHETDHETDHITDHIMDHEMDHVTDHEMDRVTVKTHGRASLPPTYAPMPQRLPRSLSSFVAGFKSSATKRINEIRHSPGRSVWQARFYDRMIRDEKGFYAVRRYIRENPVRWLISSKTLQRRSDEKTPYSGAVMKNHHNLK